jgi:hypothetical protein
MAQLAYPSTRIDDTLASARSASRAAFMARLRACSALIFAAPIRPPQMTSRDLVLFMTIKLQREAKSLQCHLVIVASVIICATYLI